jgi:hypothetical protein
VRSGHTRPGRFRGKINSTTRLFLSLLLPTSRDKSCQLNWSMQHHLTVDPPVLPLKNRSMWLTRPKLPQGSVTADLT